MSLINDALKKAQRQRNDNPHGVVPPMPGGGGGRVAKRGAPMPSQTIVMIVAGCAVLVVLSGVGAVLFVNGKSQPKPAVAAGPTTTTATTAAPATAASPSTDPSVPKIEFPITFAPVPPPSPPPEENTGPDHAAKAPPPALVESKSGPKIPAASETSGSTARTVAPPASGPRTPADERVYVFLDALRIGGIRSSGGDSRVLMNEHVYRVNDIVDRSLGLKLTIVSSDFLTFTDSNGVDYVKNF